MIDKYETVNCLRIWKLSKKSWVWILIWKRWNWWIIGLLTSGPPKTLSFSKWLTKSWNSELRSCPEVAAKTHGNLEKHDFWRLWWDSETIFTLPKSFPDCGPPKHFCYWGGPTRSSFLEIPRVSQLAAKIHGKVWHQNGAVHDSKFTPKSAK